MSDNGSKGELVRERRVPMSIILDDETEELLAEASQAYDGNLSATVRALIRIQAGILIKIWNDSDGPEPAPITRWQKPRLTKELIGFVAGIVRMVGLVDTACDYAGVTPAQKAAWIKQGRADRAAGRQSLEADFVASLDRASAESEIDRVRRLDKGNTTKGLTFLLERQKPDRYGERRRVDSEVRHSFFPAVDFDLLTPAETKTWLELTRKATPVQGTRLPKGARPMLELLPGDVLDVADAEVVDGDFAEVTEGPEAPTPET